MKLTVFKLGGSLLDLPDVAVRLHEVTSHHDAAAVVIVGGGNIADTVRAYDNRFRLTPELAHELALQAMDLNARLLAGIDSRFHLASSPSFDSDTKAAAIQVVMASKALSKIESESNRLPRSWNVTSDSIAAWLAKHWQADLVLLKSLDLQAPPPRHQLNSLADQGRVDRHFPVVSDGVSRIGWCNLRASNPSINWFV